MRFDLVIEHNLQKRIFAKLVYVDVARFSDLKPKNVESNLFMYHLKQLIKNGLVEKRTGGYSLSPAGKAFADRLSLSDFTYRIQPKVITILAVKRTDGQWLMLERMHQPYIGKIGFPSGKVHFGEQIKAAAQRELQEKAGFTTRLAYRGQIEYRFYEGETVISHIIGHVFYGTVNASVIKEQLTRSGKTFWADPAKLSKKSFIKGYGEIVKRLQQKQFFLEELVFQSDW